MQQMGINFGGSETASGGCAGGPVPTSVSVADVGIICQDELAQSAQPDKLKSRNVAKLRKILNEANGLIDDPGVICFKIGDEEAIYADFSQGKGTILNL